MRRIDSSPTAKNPFNETGTNLTAGAIPIKVDETKVSRPPSSVIPFRDNRFKRSSDKPKRLKTAFEEYNNQTIEIDETIQA